MDLHEEYLELCAASTAGELSGEEQKKLEEHLAVCASCRRARHEYEIAFERALPALADELGPPLEEPDPSWSEDNAEAAFFKRLEREKYARPPEVSGMGKAESERPGQRFTYRPSRIPWAELWMPIAACGLLTVALGVAAYRSGIKRGVDTAQQAITSPKAPGDSLEEQISDSGHERAQLLAKLTADDQAIQGLKGELREQTEKINRLKAPNQAAGGGTQPAPSDTTESSRRESELIAAQAK